MGSQRRQAHGGRLDPQDTWTEIDELPTRFRSLADFLICEATLGTDGQASPIDGAPRRRKRMKQVCGGLPAGVCDTTPLGIVGLMHVVSPRQGLLDPHQPVASTLLAGLD